ncbi:uncharacterized protein [Musca autumnalis]|uniref:uncharacterized protein n=1 Tax=Musca autumnalis TaxID=221902 RepID=UPI003CF67AF2
MSGHHKYSDNSRRSNDRSRNHHVEHDERDGRYSGGERSSDRDRYHKSSKDYSENKHQHASHKRRAAHDDYDNHHAKRPRYDKDDGDDDANERKRHYTKSKDYQKKNDFKKPLTGNIGQRHEFQAKSSNIPSPYAHLPPSPPRLKRPMKEIIEEEAEEVEVTSEPTTIKTEVYQSKDSNESQQTPTTVADASSYVGNIEELQISKELKKMKSKQRGRNENFSSQNKSSNVRRIPDEAEDGNCDILVPMTNTKNIPKNFTETPLTSKEMKSMSHNLIDSNISKSQNGKDVTEGSSNENTGNSLPTKKFQSSFTEAAIRKETKTNDDLHTAERFNKNTGNLSKLTSAHRSDNSPTKMFPSADSHNKKLSNRNIKQDFKSTGNSTPKLTPRNLKEDYKNTGTSTIERSSLNLQENSSKTSPSQHVVYVAENVDNNFHTNKEFSKNTGNHNKIIAENNFTSNSSSKETLSKNLYSSDNSDNNFNKNTGKFEEKIHNNIPASPYKQSQNYNQNNFPPRSDATNYDKRFDQNTGQINNESIAKEAAPTHLENNQDENRENMCNKSRAPIAYNNATTCGNTSNFPPPLPRNFNEPPPPLPSSTKYDHEGNTENMDFNKNTGNLPPLPNTFNAPPPPLPSSTKHTHEENNKNTGNFSSSTSTDSSKNQPPWDSKYQMPSNPSQTGHERGNSANFMANTNRFDRPPPPYGNTNHPNSTSFAGNRPQFPPNFHQPPPSILQVKDAATTGRNFGNVEINKNTGNFSQHHTGFLNRNPPHGNNGYNATLEFPRNAHYSNDNKNTGNFSSNLPWKNSGKWPQYNNNNYPPPPNIGNLRQNTPFPNFQRYGGNNTGNFLNPRTRYNTGNFPPLNNNYNYPPQPSGAGNNRENMYSPAQRYNENNTGNFGRYQNPRNFSHVPAPYENRSQIAAPPQYRKEFLNDFIKNNGNNQENTGNNNTNNGNFSQNDTYENGATAPRQSENQKPNELSKNTGNFNIPKHTGNLFQTNSNENKGQTMNCLPSHNEAANKFVDVHKNTGNFNNTNWRRPPWQENEQNQTEYHSREYKNNSRGGNEGIIEFSKNTGNFNNNKNTGNLSQSNRNDDEGHITKLLVPKNDNTKEFLKNTGNLNKKIIPSSEENHHTGNFNNENIPSSEENHKYRANNNEFQKPPTGYELKNSGNNKEAPFNQTSSCTNNENLRDGNTNRQPIDNNKTTDGTPHDSRGEVGSLPSNENNGYTKNIQFGMRRRTNIRMVDHKMDRHFGVKSNFSKRGEMHSLARRESSYPSSQQFPQVKPTDNSFQINPSLGGGGAGVAGGNERFYEDINPAPPVEATNHPPPQTKQYHQNGPSNNQQRYPPHPNMANQMRKPFGNYNQRPPFRGQPFGGNPRQGFNQRAFPNKSAQLRGRPNFTRGRPMGRKSLLTSTLKRNFQKRTSKTLLRPQNKFAKKLLKKTTTSEQKKAKKLKTKTKEKADKQPAEDDHIDINKQVFGDFKPIQVAQKKPAKGHLKPQPEEYWKQWWSLYGYVERVITPVGRTDPAVADILDFKLTPQDKEFRKRKRVLLTVGTTKILNHIRLTETDYALRDIFNVLKYKHQLEDPKFQQHLNAKEMQRVEMALKNAKKKTRRAFYYQAMICRWHFSTQIVQRAEAGEQLKVGHARKLLANKLFLYFVWESIQELKKLILEDWPGFEEYYATLQNN